MAEGEQDKSEQATPFRLQKARQKGVVARGVDLGFFVGTTVLLGYLWIAAAPGAVSVGRAIQAAIVQSGMLNDNPYSVFSVVVMLFSSAIRPILTLMASLFVAVLLFEILQTGFVFSLQPLKPDFSRMNPATGLRRLFTLRLLLETAKNVLKLGLYITAAYLIVRRVLVSDIGAIEDARSLIALMMRTAIRLVAAFSAIALFFVTLDQLIVRREFSRKMSMSRREVRREAREREGDPRLKQKRKKLHAEFSKLRQSLYNLKGSDVVITNPDHIAVALRYDRATMTAPRIVSVGVDRIAQHLKRMALLYGIPVVENRILARALYSRTALNKQIPEYCFVPVAEIYNSLRLSKNTKNKAG